ncbi:uncharacterized protein [Chelonus insularis]|uniref:uncharacterized protein n=1 Tax=Chelonus insularis TaxID=460826 RepID=UPI00158A31D9|nr:uncharacterized protein LOC118068313 [Chelonus insularis]
MVSLIHKNDLTSQHSSIKINGVVFLFLTVVTFSTDAYRILGVFPFRWKSHQIMFDAVTKGLARKGHQVDVITHFPLKESIPNYKVLVKLKHQEDNPILNEWDYKFATEFDTKGRIDFVLTGNKLCEYLGLPEIQELIKNPPNDPPYDLVMTEGLAANCFIGLAHALKVPAILVCSSRDLSWIDWVLGQPANTAFFADVFLDYHHPMTFFQRVHNTFQTHLNTFLVRSNTYSIQNALIKKYIDPNIPPLYELERKIVLALVNSYHSLEGVRPVVPNLIEVSGLHVSEHHEELSHELGQWMNESTAGVIYFSFGSMTRIETFPDDIIRAFYAAFAKLAPVRVLIKIISKTELLPGLPENVRTESWIPQVAVLAHNNTRAFITHGGLMGSQEGLALGVPMVGIPLFSDQHNNVQCFVRKNITIKLNHRNLTKDSIYEALHEILYNPKYYKTAKYEAARFRDRPLSAMDTAIFWIEYAIRHGPGVLRSPGADLPWWQAALLDVYLFFAVVFIFILYLWFLLFKKLLTILYYKLFNKSRKIHTEKQFNMPVKVTLLFISLFVSIYSIEAYRILAIFPFQSRSHQMMFDAIVKGLARKGHQIDVMTVYPLEKPIPNYKVVVNLESQQKNLVNQWDVKFASELGQDTIPIIALLFGNGLCEYLGLPEVQEIIKNPPKDPPYDLIILESFGSHCFLGLGYALNIPVVLASTTVDSSWLSDILGQPTFTTAYFPAYFTSYTHPMTFFERFCNTVMHHVTLFRYRRFTDDVQNDLMKKYIDPNIPPLRELEKNVTLALVNSYHSLHGIRPLVPNLIEVAGLHVLERLEELPHDLGKWMDESTAGVVYFTLGSMVNIETFSKDVMKAFYSVFTKLAPVRVLMKVADPSKLLPGLPENVRTESWIPQVPVLAHNNTKVFMTHGGLMSTQESLTFGVPMIGIPLFADQFSNIEFYIKKKMAVKLDYNNLTEDSIYEALYKILNDPLYQTSAKYEAARFLDRPMSAMDTTIYWIEYAIRHGPGALKSPAVDMPWWKLSLIDVFSFLFIMILFSILLIFLLLNKFLKTLLFIISRKILKLHTEWAYRILGVFPLHSRSHQMIFDAIIKGLLTDRHRVDVVTVYPLKEKFANYTLIVDLSKHRKSLENQWNFKYASKLTGDSISLIALSLGNDLCHYLALPEIQDIIKSPPKDPPYDLLIAESHAAHCFIGLGYALKIPVVLVATSIEAPWLDQSIGQPMDTTAYIGAYFGTNSYPMTFFERVYNTFISYYNLVRFRRYTDDVQNDLMKKYIDPNIPPLRELEKSVALALVNSYHSLHGVRPLVPNLIEVGGLHVYEHYEKIPHDLEKWMNESTAGVVYFTLGSMVNIETFPDDVLRAFYSVFRKISPVRVLMKVANKEKLLPGLPENVRTSSWIPQVAILAHNNTKVFITHGGLMSVQEALTFGVSMIGIPLFADQFSNIDILVKKNIAVMLNYKKLIEDEIYDAFDEILNNPKYHNDTLHVFMKLRSLIAYERLYYPLLSYEYFTKIFLKVENRVALQLKMKVLVNFLLISLLTILITKTKGYRILAVFPFHSRSHQLMYDAIAKGLARKGHQIDIITSFPIKKPIPNYNVIVNLETENKSFVNQWDYKAAFEVTDDIIPFIVSECGNNICEYLRLPEVQKIIKNPPKNPPYDLVIIESLGFNCFIGLGHVLKVPVIVATSLVDSPWLDRSLGQPTDTTAYFGACFGTNSYPMTFFERVYNTFISYYNLVRFRRYTDDVQNDLMKKYIDPNIPPLRELEKSVALALVNSYHSLHGVRPLVPNLIEVGGLHVYEHYEKIPHDLEKWMNESTAGVVYFTLGSMVNIETFPDDVLRAFYSVFRKISPVRVLMKVANKEKLLPGLPENVRTSSWIPQVAILAHNNTKVFITHGGLMSVQEALTFGVPMIGIPLFADQFSNIDLFVKKNMALKLNFKLLREVEIYNAVDKILNNPIYQNAAQYESAKFLGRPMSAMDTTIFWIEYVIKFGPNALRSPAVDMPWWQVALIDVYIFFISFIIFTVFLMVIIIRSCITLLFSQSKKRTKIA